MNNISKEEMEAILGNSSSKVVVQNDVMKKELSILQEALTSSTERVKSTLSNKLGEEITCSISDLEFINGLQVPQEDNFYVINGNFTNNGMCLHYFVYPIKVAFQFAKAYSGIEDITNSLDEVRPHIYEITEFILQDIAEELAHGFNAQLDDVIQSNNLSEIDSDSRFIRITWNIGEVKFYEFFSFSILNLLQADHISDTNKANDIEQEDVSSATQKADDMSELTSDTSDNNFASFLNSVDTTPESDSSSSEFSSFLGGSDSSESIASLGEELLKNSRSVSNVALPELNESSDATGGTGSKRDMNMLMGINMELSVELGQTRMRVEEVLDLNRGSIIELRKLAGEPLDVKVNNKLIAKGEVVVIDENFGVRIIEIISPKDRMREID